VTRRLKIELDLDAKGFAATITDAAGKVERFNKATNSTAASVQRMEKRMRGLMATARDLTLILSQVRVAIYNLRVVMTGWLEKVIQTNIEVERMTFLLAGMSDELTVADRFQEAGEQVGMMLDKAARAPFSIGAMTDSLVKMKAGGLDPLDGSLDSLIDSVAAFGGDDQMLKRASIAIQQMGGKGVVSMEELRQQLGEAVPFAMQLMARSMGLTMKDMVDSISRGEVEATSALNKMFGEFERTFGGSAARLMDTFSGRIAQARTALVKFSLAIGGFEEGTFVAGGFMDTLNSKIETFIETLSRPEAQIFAARIGESLVKLANTLEIVIGTLFKMRDIITAAGKTFLLYFGGRAVIASIAGISTAFLGAAGGATRFGAAMTAVGAATAATSRRMQIASNVSKSWALQATVLGRGLRGVGIAASGMLGPIGIFITTAFFAAEALGFFKDRAKEAEQAVKDFNAGLVSAASIEVMEKRLKTLQGEYDGVIKDIEAIIALGDEENQSYWLEKDRERAIELRKEIDALEQTIKGAREQFSADESDRAGSRIIQTLKREMTQLTQDYKILAAELATERQNVANDAELTEKQREEALKDIRDREIENVRNFYQQQLEISREFQGRIGQSIAQLQKNMVGDGTESQQQQLKNLQAQYAALAEFITDLTERATSATEIFAAAPTLFADTDEDEAVDKLANKITTLSARLAGLKADYNELSGVTDITTKTLAALNAEIEAGKYEEKTEGDIAKARELAAAIDAQVAANKRLKADNALQGRLAQQLQRASEFAREMTGVLNGDLNDAEAQAAAYALRLDLIIGKMSNVTAETIEMRKAAVEAFSRGQTARFLDGLRDTTEQIRISLLERDEAAQANFDRDIDRMWRSVDFTHLTEAEKRRAMEITNAYIEQRQAQLEEETKSQMERMLEDWTRTTDAMDQAASGWMDSFVDKLVEGELSFGDFAKSILADIAKIIIRAQIASAILAAIGGFSGDATGGGGGGAATTVGPLFHTGGIAGQHSKGSIQVSPGMFSNAPRYHNGGIAGLKPNEVPAILETGERVLTREEQRALARSGGAANVEVNIINQSGEPLKEDSRNSRFDGEKYIIDIVTAGMSRPGKLRDTTKMVAKS
jgi:tape measure domain-containing protein